MVECVGVSVDAEANLGAGSDCGGAGGPGGRGVIAG